MPSFCSSGLHEVLAECCFLVSWSCFCLLRRFPDGSVGKESARNAGDLGLIPGLGTSPGEENGNAFQYSCLENLMDRGARRATAHGVAKSQTQLSN